MYAQPFVDWTPTEADDPDSVSLQLDPNNPTVRAHTPPDLWIPAGRGVLNIATAHLTSPWWHVPASHSCKVLVSMSLIAVSDAAQANEHKDLLKCGNLSLIGDGKRTVRIVTNLG